MAHTGRYQLGQKAPHFYRRKQTVYLGCMVRKTTNKNTLPAWLQAGLKSNTQKITYRYIQTKPGAVAIEQAQRPPTAGYRPHPSPVSQNRFSRSPAKQNLKCNWAQWGLTLWIHKPELSYDSHNSFQAKPPGGVEGRRGGNSRDKATSRKGKG
jgi:hypothetical protein